MSGILKDFAAFQKSKDLYQRCKAARLPPFLKDQLIRASSSVALNLAEGSGKQTSMEQKRFYSIALGSLRECQAILELEEVDNPQLIKVADELAAILFTLCRRTGISPGTGTGSGTGTKN